MSDKQGDGIHGSKGRIYREGIHIDRKSGILFGMRMLACIQDSRKEGLSDGQIIKRLIERFSLREEETEEYMKDIELAEN